MSAFDSWMDTLPTDARAAVEERLRPRTVAQGEAVYTTGDPANELYRIRSGGVRITEYSPVGRELQLLTLVPGDCFGEIGVIDGLPRFNNAYALAATELEVLDRKSFDRLRQTHPRIEREMNLFLCGTVRRLASKVTDASILTLRERLPRLIHQLAGGDGDRTSGTDAAGVKGARDVKGVILSPVSHNDLANMLGATRQSVSRELKELEREGLIELRYRSIRVCDMSDFVHRFGSLLDGGGIDPGPSA